ncbi:MAG: RNase adapter RapZ [Deltaproteobacteria bacterium]|nr:RNase adapter RapZ [Deltaproteobacteria bacterium]
MIDTRFALITGLSGGGKSTALKMLEDSGFLAMDNFPITLFPTFIQMLEYSKAPVPKIALVVDIRGGKIEKEFIKLVQFLNEKKLYKKIVYLEAQDKIIISRFKETRRIHPLSISKNISLSQAIAEEKTTMDKIKSFADAVIDTSYLAPQIFGKILREEFSEEIRKKIILMLISFGFKYGVPIESDMVIDVRFLPNPFFIKELKDTTGKDKKTYEFVINRRETQIFLKKNEEILSFLLPLYEREGKSYFTLSYGCTGGKHRSVAIVEYMEKILQKKEFAVNILHRDIEKT